MKEFRDPYDFLVAGYIDSEKAARTLTDKQISPQQLFFLGRFEELLRLKTNLDRVKRDLPDIGSYEIDTEALLEHSIRSTFRDCEILHVDNFARQLINYYFPATGKEAA